MKIITLCRYISFYDRDHNLAIKVNFNFVCYFFWFNIALVMIRIVIELFGTILL